MHPTGDRDRDAALDALSRVIYRLSAADARLRGRATRSPEALSLTHARALRVLYEQGPQSIRDLAIGTETTPPAATQLVNGLVSAGYVTRERAPGDQRSVVVQLTDAGRTRYQDREQATHRALLEELADQNTEALNTATAVLNRMITIYDRL
ncbi:MarR family winged helix-turn-helix transcriptional regulator [Nocardia terpenica]|uniref:MarR family transcriptional regulator n=1 Tax=Nocardia terpenica TaxID=455432 RepID=A0A291RSI8_9NOCA|nr:MarR family transcriptional regulator [Nocardia terpenica]ATL70453.1 MarR family transcriptional regulator [Nocardia terpenica]